MYGRPEESIYALVKEEAPKAERPPRYVSGHSGRVAPTGSTFNTTSTSKPGVSNLGGELKLADHGAHKYYKGQAHFGGAPASGLPDPSSFLKAKTVNKPVAGLRQIQKMQPDKLKPTALKAKLKATLPTEKPIMNLVTSKNFIVANAVENILMAPKKIPSEEPDFLNKEDYGKIPGYIDRIKGDIEAEYQYIRDVRDAEVEKAAITRPLTNEERLALLEGLKAKWEEINSEYQLGTHLTKLDTVGKIARKETHESALTQIEKDIERIKRDNIQIDPSF